MALQSASVDSRPVSRGFGGFEHRAVRCQHERHVGPAPAALRRHRQHVRRRRIGQRIGRECVQHVDRPRTAGHRLSRQRVRERRFGRVHRHHPHRFVLWERRDQVRQQRRTILVGHMRAPADRRRVGAEQVGHDAPLPLGDRLERRGVSMPPPQLPAPARPSQRNHGKKWPRDRVHLARQAEQDAPGVGELVEERCRGRFPISHEDHMTRCQSGHASAACISRSVDAPLRSHSVVANARAIARPLFTAWLNDTPS